MYIRNFINAKIHSASPFKRLTCYFVMCSLLEMIHFCYNWYKFNSVQSSNAICQRRYGSTLVWIMAWHRMATGNFLNYNWLLNVDFLWGNTDYCGVRLRARYQRAPNLLFCIMSLKIVLLQVLSHFAEVNKLTIPSANTIVIRLCRSNDRIAWQII